jgi:parvulin-like peptidyl-prolyl isomerase
MNDVVTSGSSIANTFADWTVSAQRLLADHGLLRPLLRQVLIAEAVADQVLSDEQRQQALVGFAQQRGLDSQEALQRFAEAQLLSPQALNQQIELPLRLQQHCGQHFSAKAEARFLERKQQLDQVVYSLLRVPSEGLARELYLQLQDGEASFSDLAARYSEGPEKSSGGIVGPAPQAQGHPLLVQRLRTAAPGALLEPFQIEQWWLVVRLESLRPAIFDERMALQMSQELFEQWLEQQVDQEIQRLRPLVLDQASEVR